MRIIYQNRIKNDDRNTHILIKNFTEKEDFLLEDKLEKCDLLIDIGGYPVGMVLNLLLADKSTKRNIIWATDTYEEYGEGFTDKVQMDAQCLLMRPELIRPRILKSQEAQVQRTRKKAEVFTPAWLCNRMNNTLDEDWFGRTGVFNTENEDHTWNVTEGKSIFRRAERGSSMWIPADWKSPVAKRLTLFPATTYPPES